MRRCPVCFGWINNKAAKCKHCQSVIKRNENCEDTDYAEYVTHGFRVIERECEALDNEISAMAGSFFQRHLYTEEELLNSKHLEKISSIANKMGDDIENWKVNKKLSLRIESMFHNELYMAEERVNRILERLKNRHYTLWERISEFFVFTYYFIFNIALFNIKGVMPDMKTPKKYAKPLRIINKTFENLNKAFHNKEDDEEVDDIEKMNA
jgi:hypothetical protein